MSISTREHQGRQRRYEGCEEFTSGMGRQKKVSDRVNHAGSMSTGLETGIGMHWRWAHVYWNQEAWTQILSQSLASHFITLCLSFSICNMRIIVLTSLGCSEDNMG